MPSFVVLTHDFPALHWDFMLEKEAALRTWRLAQPPDSGGKIEAVALPDHRTAYLDYEGPVSGNRGHVVRWDGGEFAPISEEPTRLEVELHGGRLEGRAVLAATEGGWTFYLISDPA